MAGNPLNAWGEMSLAIKEGRQVEPPSLFATFMAMPKADLAQTAVKAVQRIAELKTLTSGLEELAKKDERIHALNKEILALMPQQFAEDQGRRNANARWTKLDPVKDWAFDQRRNNPLPSRASVIRGILPQLLKKARDADVPLSGSSESAIATITRWFRKAGIK